MERVDLPTSTGWLLIRTMVQDEADLENVYTLQGQMGLAYGEDNFLIDNELDRYLIGDRSELAYNADGSLDILVQAAPLEDPALQGNWLPVKDAPFHLYLRVYLPDKDALAKEWAAPTIEKL